MMTQMLIGSGATPVVLRSASYSKAGTFCEFSLITNGNVVAEGAVQYTWLITGVSGDYDVFVTPVTGTTSGSSVNTWLSLASPRQWTVTSPGSGELVQATFDVSIRDHVTLSVYISGVRITITSIIGAGP